MNSPAVVATSRTRAMTSSSGNSVDDFTFGNSELMSQTAGVTLPLAAAGTKSQVTKETSASGSAAGASSALATPSVRSFCGLNGGMLAESSETDSARLPETRTKGRVRTSSRSRSRVVTGMRRIWRATLGSVMAGSRSVLRTPLRRPPMLATAPRNAVSRRSGAEAKLVSPSSEAKTAPPMRAAPHSPVRMVPLNHCSENRRRSTSTPVPPSTESGGSLPR